MTSCRAIVLHRHGGVDVLEPAVIDVPDPGPGRVRVRVRAVALNHLDLWVRRGLPGLKLAYPHRLGSDIAGDIDAVGPGVTHVAPGQRVLVAPGVSCGVCEACLGGHDNLCPQYGILGETVSGGYSELVDIAGASALPYPGELPYEQAAAVPLTFVTAWQMVVERARVRPGETVLVQGAGSGVGVAAIQIAKLHGARVWAVAGTEDKCRRALALGAEAVFNHATTDWLHEVKKRTDRKGVDVVIEHVGGETFTRSVLAVARGGRVVTCGATSGFHPEVDLRQIFFRNVQVLGSTMGPRAALFEIVRQVAAGRLAPVVDRVLPLSEAREAHRVLEAREAFGKVVLSVG